MTREEFTEKASHILDILDDRGAVSTALDEIRTGFYEEVEKRETAETSVTELTEKNKGLQEANMDLFLKVGKVATGKDDTSLDEPDEPKEKEPEIKYDELFDDKGELI